MKINYTETMLSQEDIQQIGAVIRDHLAPVTQQMAGIERRIDDSEHRLGEQIATIDHKLDRAQEDIASILTTVIDYHTALAGRVDRIEERLRS